MKIIFILWLMAAITIFASCSADSSSAVRGVWLTNVDSDVLFSEEGIKNAVDYCHDLGINSIFVVTWNKGYTLYPSKVMKKLIGEEIDPKLAGRDPLKELITEAHLKGIKVIAWFEFGFSPSHDKTERKILDKKPEWGALNKDGELVVKNGFHWLNGFNPEVQSFILSLIMEVVENYDIDGIQGDDRLPALPSEAGYDPYTKELYKRDHNGSLPPDDPKEPGWVQWRADLLTDYMKTIYLSVKGYDSEKIVSMAPSIYPWSKEEYLQDWPRWVNEGYVDLICPQLYRYEFDEYKKALDDILDKQLSENNFHKFYPGILLKVGDYYPSEEYLLKMIEYNREKRVFGEVFFFYEGLKKYPELFKNVLYTKNIDFPNLTD